MTVGRAKTGRAAASTMAATAGASWSVTVPEMTTATRASGSGGGASATDRAAAPNSNVQQASATSTTYSDPSPYQSSQRTAPTLVARPDTSHRLDVTWCGLGTPYHG